MRQARTLTLCLLLFLLASCQQKGPQVPDKPISKITDKVFVIHGSIALPNKKNMGFINNPGFVLTKKGVVIIDPGSSVKVGQMVLDKIRSVTSEPIIAVFNTHIHGDHWLGNGAIKQAFPRAVIYAHPNMKAMADAGDGHNWVKLFDQMTEGGLVGTKPVAPDIAVNNEETLNVGGMKFRVHHFGKAHTDGDLMVEVVDESVVFLGDMSLHGRIGLMDDGDFKGNVASLDKMIARKFKHYVPGHGQSGGVEVARTYRTYLDTVYQTVKKLYDEVDTDFEMKPRVVKEVDFYKQWLEFEKEVGRHISLAYQQVEKEAF